MRLLLVLMFLSGCASVKDNVRERNYIASFKTTLGAEDFVVCMNANSVYDIVWLPPTEYTETTEITYNLSSSMGFVRAGEYQILYENGVVEFYESSPFAPKPINPLKQEVEYYQKVCG